MTSIISLACQPKVHTLGVANILPLCIVAPGTRTTGKYRRIASSIREVGIIEPLVVHPSNASAGQYLLLDGHVRLDILSRLGVETVECLVSTDDEAFTYNHKVNRLSAIQEHFMILKAIKGGVTEEAIARALDIDVANIRSKRDLLSGICSEAVELLRGKAATAGGLRQYRKVKAMRQIEMAELMCASNNFSAGYAKCLVAATPNDQMVPSEIPKAVEGLSGEDMSRMERELESISGDFREIEETHGKNVLNLVVVAGYLRKLLDNAKVVRHLAQRCPEILTEFQRIAESRSLSD